MAEEIRSLDDTILTKSQVAALFGHEARWIDRLCENGVLHPIYKGRSKAFPLRETVSDYIKYIKAGRPPEEQASIEARQVMLKEQKLKADIRWKEAQGELQDLKAKIAAGDYVAVADLEHEYGQLFARLKQFLLGWPARIVGMISGEVPPDRIRIIESEISAEIRTQMTDFVVSQCDPDVIKSAVSSVQKTAVSDAKPKPTDSETKSAVSKRKRGRPRKDEPRIKPVK